MTLQVVGVVSVSVSVSGHSVVVTVLEMTSIVSIGVSNVTPQSHCCIVTVAVRPPGGRLLHQGRAGADGGGGRGGLQPGQVQDVGDGGDPEDDREAVGGGNSREGEAVSWYSQTCHRVVKHILIFKSPTDPVKQD